MCHCSVLDVFPQPDTSSGKGDSHQIWGLCEYWARMLVGAAACSQCFPPTRDEDNNRSLTIRSTWHRLLVEPADSFILTLGCGKYRIRDYDYGTLLGLPRLLDMGQCNNAYGAIKVAVGLAEALGCTVNDLPLTLVVSWFEQKAVAVLLTLLAPIPFN